MRETYDEGDGGSETSDEDAKIQNLLSEWEASRAAAMSGSSSKLDSSFDEANLFDLGPSAVRLPKDDEDEEEDEDDEEEMTQKHENTGATDPPAEDDAAADDAMNALLDEWGDGSDGDDGNDDHDEQGDIHQKKSAIESDNEEGIALGPPLEDCVLDHIVLAAPDLEEAMEYFKDMTGVMPKECPSVKGVGIRCARVAFENDTTCYLEIIAPDVENPGPIGKLIVAKGIPELTPFAFAIRYRKVEALKSQVLKFNYVPDHICMFGKPSSDSGKKPKNYERLHLYGHTLGGICPFFIHWGKTDHPTRSLEVVGILKKFSVRAPNNDPLHQLMTHVNVQGVHVVEGSPKLSFQFNSPEGTVKFASSKPVGFKFPGFDEDA